MKAKGKVMTKGKDYVVEDGYVSVRSLGGLMKSANMKPRDIILIKAGAAKS